MQTAQQPKPKRYALTAKVKQRYGGVSNMWLWRRERNDPNWPRPIVIGRRKFYDEDELDAYDEACRKGGANASAA